MYLVCWTPISSRLLAPVEAVSCAISSDCVQQAYFRRISDGIENNFPSGNLSGSAP
jgi:hypothetical protein